jgi:hypothetical protein
VIATRIGVSAAILLFTVLGFFFLPGHTYLQSDTQIYVPVIEWLSDPSLYENELIRRGAHISLTIYDEMARAFRWITGDLQSALQLQQWIFRACGIFGIYLLASSCGLSRKMGLLVAGLCSLGVTVIGPAVLTIEYEPVPRGFALGLMLLALGLLAYERDWLAGIVAAIAFLYHAPAVWPFWFAVFLLPRKRQHLIPLGIAALILIPLAISQTGIAERQNLFTVLTPEHAELQRMRASYNWVSTWFTRYAWFYAVAWVVALVADYRVRNVLPLELRIPLLVMPAVGILTMPASYLLLEKLHWAFIPQFQPMRALLYTVLFAIILAALAGAKATRWPERLLWFALVLWFPFAHTTFTWDKVRTGTLNYPKVETPDLTQLSTWARTTTGKNVVFLFPDEGKALPPGIFRARSLRAVYVDWKAGGQVNYFPQYALEWWKRWNEAMVPAFTPERVPTLADLGIDYLVLSKSSIPNAPMVWQNASYRVYKIR